MIRKSIIILYAGLNLVGCTQKKEAQETVFTGRTQGTTYSIRIAEKNVQITQQEIENLLAEFDLVFSTYNQQSIVSQFNNAEKTHQFYDRNSWFQTCYLQAQELYELSDGLFDPSVYSLVQHWGFFDKNNRIPTQKQIDSILSFTGFKNGLLHQINFYHDSVFLTKNKPEFKLDFNAIAQGYSVDIVADLLNKKGYKNYFIEIGGEIYVRGKNKEKKKWNIGIETPDENTNKEIITTLSLTDKGIATSGTYRNFFEEKGVKYAHILNPTTGRPAPTDILSATVIASNATLADAYATLFVIWGREKSLHFIEKQKDIDAIIISVNPKGVIQVDNTFIR